MATLLLSAAGAAVGAGFGGTVLGLSGAVIGHAVGATLGRAIDQRALGAGSEAVDGGKVDFGAAQRQHLRKIRSPVGAVLVCAQVQAHGAGDRKAYAS